MLDWLLLPVLGAPGMVNWIATKLLEEAERESWDEGRVRVDLLELQQRYDTGEIEDEEYDERETALLSRLSAIREFKASHGR